MATYQHGQRRVVRELYELHTEALSGSRPDPAIFPRDLQPDLVRLLAAADRAGADVEVLRLVADHIGEMTDAAAARMHRRLTGHVDGRFNDYQ